MWWAPRAPKQARQRNLEVWRVPSAQSLALAALADRSMQLQVTVQDGLVWFGNGRESVEIAPERWHPAP